jgi:hypothetical protein
MKIALCDAFHVNKRNFTSLFSYLEKKKNLPEPQYLIPASSPNMDLVKAVGVYDREDPRLKPYFQKLEEMEPKELFSIELHNVPVFDVAVSEVLARCLPNAYWHESPVRNEPEVIFAKLIERDLQILIGGMAAAMFWLDTWYRMRAELYNLDNIVVFSGSYIYGRALIELLTFSQCRAIVLESSFTGNDYFFEERYRPLSNSTILQNRNVWTERRNAFLKLGVAGERETIKALNKVFRMSNKNVVQPDRKPLPPGFQSGKTVLVLGQVVNDFSMTDGGGVYVNSIAVYRCLIAELLRDENVRVIFKGHPWEWKKVHVKGMFTCDAIRADMDAMPQQMRDRLLLVDDFNLRQLFEACDAVFTLCSQGGIEAAMMGFKTYTLGRPFYRSFGFTHDFDDPVLAARAYLGPNAQPRLTLSEFEQFVEYLTVLTQFHLASIHPSGEARVGAVLETYKTINVERTSRGELQLAKSKPAEAALPSVAAAAVEPATVSREAAAKIDVPAKPPSGSPAVSKKRSPVAASPASKPSVTKTARESSKRIREKAPVVGSPSAAAAPPPAPALSNGAVADVSKRVVITPWQVPEDGSLRPGDVISLPVNIVNRSSIEIPAAIDTGESTSIGYSLVNAESGEKIGNGPLSPISSSLVGRTVQKLNVELPPKDGKYRCDLAVVVGSKLWIGTRDAISVDIRNGAVERFVFLRS